MSKQSNRDRSRLVIFVGLLIAFGLGIVFQAGIEGGFLPPPTYTPYPTYTPLPSSTATYTPSPTATPTATATYTPSPTATFTSTPTNTPTSTPTSTPTNTPTVTPTFTPLPTYTPYPTNTPPPTYTPYPTYTPPPTATPTNTSLPPEIVHRNFKELGILVTASEEAGQEVEVSVNAGIANLCGHGANHFSYGVIEAGIDFSAIDESDIEPPALGILGGYTIQLPPPQITGCRIEYIKQYDGSFTLCGANWDTVRRLAQHEAMENFIAAAKDGILPRAKKEAGYVVENFVRGLTNRPVRVEFTAQEGELELPQSCESSIPAGWVKGEKGAWKRE